MPDVCDSFEIAFNWNFSSAGTRTSWLPARGQMPLPIQFLFTTDCAFLMYKRQRYYEAASSEAGRTEPRADTKACHDKGIRDP